MGKSNYLQPKPFGDEDDTIEYDSDSFTGPITDPWILEQARLCVKMLAIVPEELAEFWNDYLDWLMRLAHHDGRRKEACHAH